MLRNVSLLVGFCLSSFGYICLVDCPTNKLGRKLFFTALRVIWKIISKAWIIRNKFSLLELILLEISLNKCRSCIPSITIDGIFLDESWSLTILLLLSEPIYSLSIRINWWLTILRWQADRNILRVSDTRWLHVYWGNKLFLYYSLIRGWFLHCKHLLICFWRSVDGFAIS